MRMKSVMLLAIAAGFGLVAMFVFQQVMSRQAQATVEETVKILVTKVEVAPGTKIDETNTEFKEFPLKLAPPNVLTSKEEYSDRAIKVRLYPGEIITADKVTKKGQYGATNDIPPGFTATTIVVDPSMTASGLLSAGDRVDVMVTHRSLNQNGLGKDIKTVLEYVEVFAIGSQRESTAVNAGGDSQAKTITVLVTPENGKLLKLAEDVGKLHLAMRSREDSKMRTEEKDRFNAKEAQAITALVSNSNRDEGGKQDINNEALKMFLDAQNKGSQPTEPFAVAAVPTVPKWEIEIIAGGKSRIEYVDDPDAIAAAALPPSPTSQPVKKNPVVEGFRALFGGGNPPAAPVEIPTSNGPQAAAPKRPALAK